MSHGFRQGKAVDWIRASTKSAEQLLIDHEEGLERNARVAQLLSMLGNVDQPAVYLVSTHDKKFTKIGYVANAANVKQRVAELQIGTPFPLHVDAIIDRATQQDERCLHVAFADQRIRGEWFLRQGPLEEFIAYCTEIMRDRDDVFDWLCLGS